MIQRERCRNVLGSLLNSQAVSPWSATGVALDCQTIKGNSGSPIMNTMGEVVGIVQAYRPQKYSQLVEANFRRFNLKMPEKIKRHSIFTNLSCVSFKDSLFQAPECNTAKHLGFTECLGTSGADNMKRAQEAIDIWQKDLPEIFLYDIVSKKSDGSIEARARCVKPETQEETYATFVKRKGIAGLGGRRLEITYPRIYKLGANMEIDSDLRLESQLNFREDYRLNYRMRLDQKRKAWTGIMTSTFKDPSLRIDLTKIELPVQLNECTEEELKDGNQAKVEILDGTELSEIEFLKLGTVEEPAIIDCKDKNIL